MASQGDVGRGRYRHPERLDGFPALASFIGEESEAEIFRRFSCLGARNLLHLQSVVSDLERQLNGFDKHDADNAAGNLALRQTARSYSYLRTVASTGSGNGHDGVSRNHAMERIALHKQITIAIKEYRVYNASTYVTTLMERRRSFDPRATTSKLQESRPTAPLNFPEIFLWG